MADRHAAGTTCTQVYGPAELKRQEMTRRPSQRRTNSAMLGRAVCGDERPLSRNIRATYENLTGTGSEGQYVLCMQTMY